MRYRRTAIGAVMEAMPATRRRTLASALESFAQAAGEHSDTEEPFLPGLPS